MILCDTGPLVALFDSRDPHHVVSRDAVTRMPATMFVTTWPCMTEAMYLLDKVGGHAAQDELWKSVEMGLVLIYAKLDATARMRSLMAKYKDTPMDFADASLVVAAEQMDERRVFTFDQHFRVYLFHDQFPFDVIP